MDRRVPFGAVSLLLALVVVSCGHDREDGDDGVTSPSALNATPAPSPIATPTATPSATPAPSPSATPTPAATPTPSTTQGVTVSFVQDIKPIMDADCVRCHRGLASYSGVMAYVRAGDANSALIQFTASGGSMNRYLSGSSAAKAELIRRWIVENGAAETR